MILTINGQKVECYSTHPGGDYVRFVSGYTETGAIGSGYLPMTEKEIEEHRHWQEVLLPLKQHERELARRQKGYSPIKALLDAATKARLERLKAEREGNSVLDKYNG